jgi:hypothetical protein
MNATVGNGNRRRWAGAQGEPDVAPAAHQPIKPEAATAVLAEQVASRKPEREYGGYPESHTPAR